MSLKGKTAIVTGAGAGIGKAIAIGLARQGAHLVMPVRDAAKGDVARAEIAAASGSADITLMRLDLASFDSIRAFSEALAQISPRVDILVSNAGVVPGVRRVTGDGMELALAVNALAPFLLVNRLRPLLARSARARVVFTGGSSEKQGRIAWDDIQSEHGYRFMTTVAQSKLALLLVAYGFARRNPDMAVNVFDPGPTRTGAFADLPRIVRIMSLFFKSPAKAAETAVWLASSAETAAISGRCFKDRTAIATSVQSQDAALADRFWVLAAELTGLARDDDA